MKNNKLLGFLLALFLFVGTMSVHAEDWPTYQVKGYLVSNWQSAPPPADASGKEWYEVGYDDSFWKDIQVPIESFTECGAYYVRYKFATEKDMSMYSASLKIESDDDSKYYLNGQYIGSRNENGSEFQLNTVVGENQLAAVVYDYGGLQFLRFLLDLKQGFETDDFKCATNGDNTCSIVGAKRNKYLEIPETVEYNGKTFTVTEIGDNAFHGCTWLKAISLPSTLKRIGNYAFAGTVIKSIAIPDNVETIGDLAFEGSAITSVSISPASRLSWLGYYCFISSQLKSIYIPKNAAMDRAFAGCSTLESIEFAEDYTVTRFENDFSGSGIVSIVIPRSIETLNSTFEGCVNLQDVFIPDNVSIITENTFGFTPKYNPFLVFESKDPDNFSEDAFAEGQQSKFYARVPASALEDYKEIWPDLNYITTDVTSIRLHQSNVSVNVNNTCRISVSEILPSDALPKVRWSSADPTIAKVDRDGVITGLKAGTTTITATAMDGSGVTATCEVTVVYIPLTSISFARDEYKLKVGDEFALPITTAPLNASDRDFTLTSSDENVVKVTPEGNLVAKGVGTAKVTAVSDKDANVKAEVNFTVNECQAALYFVEDRDGDGYVAIYDAQSNGCLRNDNSTVRMVEDDETNNLAEWKLVRTSDDEQVSEVADGETYYIYNVGGKSYMNYDGSNWLRCYGGKDNPVKFISDGKGAFYMSLRGYLMQEEPNLNTEVGFYKETESVGEWMLNIFSGEGNVNAPTIEATRYDGNDIKGDYTLPEYVGAEQKYMLGGIGDRFFADNKELTSLTLPACISSIGDDAFAGCDNLEQITFTAEKPAVLRSRSSLPQNCLFLVPDDALEAYRNAEVWSEYTLSIVPQNASTMALSVSAMESASGLRNAVHNACQGDVEAALANVAKLKLTGSINGYDIFIMRNRMTRLVDLDLSEVTVKASPFEYYTDSYTETDRLGKNAFRELQRLQHVVLPQSVKYVGEFAFYDCNSLRTVKTGNSLLDIDNWAFMECNKLADVELNEGLLSIGYETFRECNNLKNIELPSTLLSLGDIAFYGCYNLKKVVIPSGLQNIGEHTFSQCHKLETVILSNGVKTIGYGAFNNCQKLTEVRIPPMVEEIGNEAFRYCDNLKDVYVYMANPKDIRINMNTFSSWQKATLHIPTFSYDAYYFDTQWGQFYNKAEFDEEYDLFYTKNTLKLDSNTGVISGEPDATFYEQAGFEVEDEDQELGDVEMKSEGDKGASVIAKGNGNIHAKKLEVTINVTEYQWHFFSFPFDVPLSSIVYDGDYVWRKYDGEKRSRREGGWQDLDANDKKLHKNRGYIFQGTTTGELKLMLENVNFKQTDEQVAVEGHESESAQDAGWNFLGNPYTSYYVINEDTYSQPITVWVGDHYEAYRPGDDDYAFYPYQAFFIQAEENGSVGFDSNNQSSYTESKEKVKKARALRAQRKTRPDRLLMDLTVMQDDSVQIDKTRIVFNNAKSMGYEMNCDASKFTSADSKVEIFTLDNNGTRYAINERPAEDGCVRMGITTRVAGKYSIASQRSDCHIWLKDRETGITHDLSTGSYEFQAKVGEDLNRFIVGMYSEPTSLSQLTAKTGITLTADNGITIAGTDGDVETTVYNLEGKKMGSLAGNGTIAVGKGAYIVKVGLVTVKVMNK